MRAGLVVEVEAPALVVLVGPAGAGKSTFAARHFAPTDVLSSDAYREAVSGDPGDQSVTRLAFAILHREVVRRLAAGRLVVVDATNVRSFARRALVRRAAAAGAPSVAVVFDLPESVVLARNAARPRRVPEAAVRAQLDELRRTGPTLREDGFERVVLLRSPDEVDRVQVVRTAG